MPDAITMRADIRERWLTALRSGAYQQRTGKLHTKGGFCCLGVLCDLAVKDGEGEWMSRDDNGVSYRSENGFYEKQGLLSAVREWAGLSEDFGNMGYGIPGSSLATLNDSGRTFDQIADVIERRIQPIAPSAEDVTP